VLISFAFIYLFLFVLLSIANKKRPQSNFI